MKKNRLLSAMIVAGCLAGAPAYGQQPGAAPLYPPPLPLGEHTTEPIAAPAESAPNVLSDWILGKRADNCCEGAPGWRTPLYTEWYVTSGVSVPISRATSALARDMQTGWSLGGGARALFFNETLDRAWYVDLGILNTNQSAGHANQGHQGYPLTVYQGGAKIVYGRGGLGLAELTDSTRTMVGLGLGRFWYLWGTADSPGRHWRVGVDFGGRYGSHRIDIAQVGHVTDTCTGVYAGLRSDLEWTCKSVVVFAGARLEWAYTASDILQTQNSDMQDLNIMVNFGFRY